MLTSRLVYRKYAEAWPVSRPLTVTPASCVQTAYMEGELPCVPSQRQKRLPGLVGRALTVKMPQCRCWSPRGMSGDDGWAAVLASWRDFMFTNLDGCHWAVTGCGALESTFCCGPRTGQQSPAWRWGDTGLSSATSAGKDGIASPPPRPRWRSRRGGTWAAPSLDWSRWWAPRSWSRTAWRDSAQSPCPAYVRTLCRVPRTGLWLPRQLSFGFLLSCEWNGMGSESLCSSWLSSRCWPVTHISCSGRCGLCEWRPVTLSWVMQP